MSPWGLCPQAPGVYRFGGIKRGRGNKERQSPQDPAPPSSPHLGARVALQHCSTLRVGTYNLRGQSALGKEMHGRLALKTEKSSMRANMQ